MKQTFIIFIIFWAGTLHASMSDIENRCKSGDASQCEKACNIGGILGSCFMAGHLYEESGNIDKALKYQEKTCTLGNSPMSVASCGMAGMKYSKKSEGKKAVPLLEKACYSSSKEIPKEVVQQSCDMLIVSYKLANSPLYNNKQKLLSNIQDADKKLLEYIALLESDKTQRDFQSLLTSNETKKNPECYNEVSKFVKEYSKNRKMMLKSQKERYISLKNLKLQLGNAKDMLTISTINDKANFFKEKTTQFESLFSLFLSESIGEIRKKCN